MNLLELKNSKCYFAKHYQRKVNSFTLALTLINLLRTTKSKPLESAAQTLTFVWLNKRISSTKKTKKNKRRQDTFETSQSEV